VEKLGNGTVCMYTTLHIACVLHTRSCEHMLARRDVAKAGFRKFQDLLTRFLCMQAVAYAHLTCCMQLSLCCSAEVCCDMCSRNPAYRPCIKALVSLQTSSDGRSLINEDASVCRECCCCHIFRSYVALISVSDSPRNTARGQPSQVGCASKCHWDLSAGSLCGV
jgi:hypothetical protein